MYSLSKSRHSGVGILLPSLSVHQINRYVLVQTISRFHPPGKCPIKVCLGTACHVHGGDIILENFERKLEIKEGQTTPDQEFSIERVACVGCCALAPVTVVGQTVHGGMAPSKVEGLILRFEIEKEMQARDEDRDQSDE